MRTRGLSGEPGAAVEPGKIGGMAELRDLRSTRLVLIRNAQQAYSDPPRLLDHDDLGLSEEGRDQAERLRNRLAATGELAGATRLLSSNARKAIETANIISPALGNLALETDCSFCEPHNGECDGMPVNEWLATLGKERVANWSPYSPKSPGGESHRETIERSARAFIETVLANEGGTVVIVTQTVPLRASLWNFLSLPFHATYVYPGNTAQRLVVTGITEWIADGFLAHSGEMQAHLIRYNDHAHLRPGAWGRHDPA